MAQIDNHYDETEEESEEFGEHEPGPPFPKKIDIDDGIERDITIEQEVFGVIYQYGTEFEVMCFTLKNKGRDSIQVKVSSLGATLVSVVAPDRKGIYQDVVLGFDSVDMYYCPYNPGFGRITSLCPLPYNLEKIVWEWDFDRDDGSITFSTAFYKIDLVLSVKYKLTTENEIIIDMKACGAKILPLSLTSQVYWNLAGHGKGEEAMRHHALSLNSDRIWKHYNHKLKNFISINGTKLDFRIPTLMDDAEVFGDKDFEYVYVVSKGSIQTMSFLARLIHPRTCRYVEIYSDQPWMLCNTFNKMPRQIPPPQMEYWGEDGDIGEDGYLGESGTGITGLKKNSGGSQNLNCSSKDRIGNQSSESLPCLVHIPGKNDAEYVKRGSFCVTPMSDLTTVDPLVRPGSHYGHTIIYKVGVYRRYAERPKYVNEESDTRLVDQEQIVDIVQE